MNPCSIVVRGFGRGFRLVTRWGVREKGEGRAVEYAEKGRHAS